MKKKVLLFDLDGTIMNTKQGITRCAAYALEHFGIVVENLDEMDFFIGPPLHKSFEMFYGFDEEQTAQAVKYYRERYKDIGIFECEPYPGMKETISQLAAKGYQIGLATSKPEVFAVKILKKYGFASYFTHSVGSLLDNSRSDKAEVIEEAFRRFGIGKEYGEVYKKEEVLMIGDRSHDILGAKAAGIESMGVKFGFGKDKELEEAGANYIAETAEDIVRLIGQMTNQESEKEK